MSRGISDLLAPGRDTLSPQAEQRVASNQAALHESEQRFRQIAEAISHAYWVADLQPIVRLSYVNPAFERIWGRPAADLYAEPTLWMNALHPDDRGPATEAYEYWQADPQHRELAIEFRIVRPDGDIRWVLGRGQVILDEHGKVCRVTGLGEDITARKQAEQSAQAAQDQFRTLAEALPHLIWACDASGECDYISPQWFSYTGLPINTSLHDCWPAALHPQDRDEVLALWFSAVQDRSRFDRTFRLRRFDGVYRCFESRALPQRDPAGTVVRWFGTCTDVQDAKDVSQALRDEHDLLTSIAKVAPAILHSYRIGSDGKESFPFNSERVAELYGVAAEGLDVDSTRLADQVHRKDVTISTKIDASARSMTALNLQYRVYHPTRGKMWLETHSQPVAQADGAVVWQGTITDITERKHAEQALARSEAMFEAVFANLAEGIMVFTPDAHLTHCNLAAASMYDLAARQLPTSLREFSAEFEIRDANGQAVELMHRPIARILRGEALIDAEAQVHSLAGGWTKDYSFSGSLMRDAQGKATFAVVHIRDVTARKRAASEVHDQNAQLEQRVKERTAALEIAVKELEAFSYSVSHDLRAPLRALDGFSQAVLQDYRELLPETGQRYLTIIRESAQKMGQLIDDLLAFARISRQQPKWRTVDNAMLVRNALQQLAPLQEDRQLELRVGDLPACDGDPAMLHQVWINLLSNALKYSRKTEKALVEVGALASEDGPVYFVRDNGTGFDMRFAHKLFGVFERLHRADEFEGTGVGLAIVQRIIHRHGGSIRAEAELGHGATFFFTLRPSA